MKKIRWTLPRLIGIPIISFILIMILANGIRELIDPEWEILIMYPVIIVILAWLELFGIGLLTILSIYTLIILYYVTTKFIGAPEFEKALRELKKDD